MPWTPLLKSDCQEAAGPMAGLDRALEVVCSQGLQTLLTAGVGQLYVTSGRGWVAGRREQRSLWSLENPCPSDSKRLKYSMSTARSPRDARLQVPCSSSGTSSFTQQLRGVQGQGCVLKDKSQAWWLVGGEFSHLQCSLYTWYPLVLK